MALKALLLKKELDGKRSAMNKLNREEEFEKRTAELEAAIKIFCVCVKICAIEKYLAE